MANHFGLLLFFYQAGIKLTSKFIRESKACPLLVRFIPKFYWKFPELLGCKQHVKLGRYKARRKIWLRGDNDATGFRYK
jgi:hypothetical protein